MGIDNVMFGFDFMDYLEEGFNDITYMSIVHLMHIKLLMG